MNAGRPSALLTRGVLFLLLFLPWVHPIAGGPTRNAWPWLIAAACLAGLVLLRRHLDFELVLRAWLAAALLSSVMALLQYLGAAPHLAPWVWPAGPGEGFGNLRQRNQFGSFTAMGLACLLVLKARNLPWMGGGASLGLAAGGVLLLALGQAASQSRTGFVAWVLVSLAGAWCFRSRARPASRLAWLALLLGVAAALFLPRLLIAIFSGLGWDCAAGACGVMDRFSRTGSDSRLALWHNVLTLIFLRPWTGWGWGELDFAHFITLYPGVRFSERLDNAHNLPLQLAVELGLPLALLVCAGITWLVWRARPWQERDPLRWAAWAVLGVIGLHSLLEYPLWYGPFQMAAILSAAWLWRSRPGGSAWRSSGWQPAWAGALLGGNARRGLLDLSASVLLALLLAAAWDYHRVSQVYLPAAKRSAWYAADPLGHAQRSWLFRDQAAFATLALTPVNDANAQALNTLARQLLHYSPEPVVIDKLLDSALLLGRLDEAAFYARRYQAALPADHARWLARQPASLLAPARSL